MSIYLAKSLIRQTVLSLMMVFTDNMDEIKSRRLRRGRRQISIMTHTYPFYQEQASFIQVHLIFSIFPLILKFLVSTFGKKGVLSQAERVFLIIDLANVNKKVKYLFRLGLLFLWMKLALKMKFSNLKLIQELTLIDYMLSSSMKIKMYLPYDSVQIFINHA